MIAVKFLHDTPFDRFEGVYKLAVDFYGDVNVNMAYDKKTRHIYLEVWGIYTVEEIKNDLAEYSHWIEVVG